MEIDFDASDRTSDYITVPAGSYLCRIAEVRPGHTRAGDERWSLRLVVAEGEHVGKQAAWDSLVFSQRGRQRARIVFAALGMGYAFVFTMTILPATMSFVNSPVGRRPRDPASGLVHLALAALRVRPMAWVALAAVVFVVAGILCRDLLSRLLRSKVL